MLIRIRSGVLGLICLLGLAGCASSERKIAKTIDSTPQIERQASDLIAADSELKRCSVTVDGFKGMMRVKGTVRTEAQKKRAEKLVWAIQGVKSVENDLHVQAQAAAKQPF